MSKINTQNIIEATESVLATLVASDLTVGKPGRKAAIKPVKEQLNAPLDEDRLQIVVDVIEKVMIAIGLGGSTEIERLTFGDESPEAFEAQLKKVRKSKNFIKHCESNGIEFSRETVGDGVSKAVLTEPQLTIFNVGELTVVADHHFTAGEEKSNLIFVGNILDESGESINITFVEDVKKYLTLYKKRNGQIPGDYAWK